jgi:DNA-binding phage protein
MANISRYFDLTPVSLTPVSPRNPRLSTLLAVLEATGLRQSLQAQKSMRDRAA